MAKTTQIPNHLLAEITTALESVKFGSIEIFIQNKVITQITVRNIHKTSVEIEKEESQVSTSIQSISHSHNSQTQTTIQRNSVKIR